ncbi:hypothetical protein EMCRGX_G026646 [Ephydatia muelleri]
MDGPSTPRSQRSNRQMPTPSSGVNPPSSSAGNPYVVPSDFRGRDAASNSNRSGGNSVTVTVPVSSTANINTQSSSNKATLETMAKNIADNTACLQGILKELKQMSDAINEQTRRSFSIEHSSYKAAVNSVLKQEVQLKYKYDAAMSYCTSRISELRAEERRRIFGRHPCQSFTSLKAEEFVIKFLPVLHTEYRLIPNFRYHVAILRRYCRTEASSKDDTYKGFKQWLSSMYLNGKPSPQEMEDIFKEEEELVSPSFHPPTQDEQPSVEDAMLSDAEGYNPEF